MHYLRARAYQSSGKTDLALSGYSETIKLSPYESTA
jgi:Tfp pilus assembly protein PilF